MVPPDRPTRELLQEQLARAPRPAHEELHLAKSIYRRVSIHLTRRLLGTSTTPNQVTLAGVLTCAAGAALVAGGGPHLALVGVLLLHSAMVLAACDGELARARKLQSWIGVFYDYLATRWAKPLIIVGALCAHALLQVNGGTSGSLGGKLGGDLVLFGSLVALGTLAPWQHAATHWLWIQRLKATDELHRAIERAQPAGRAAPEGRGFFFALRAVADGQPHALVHLVTVAVVLDLVGALDLLGPPQPIDALVLLWLFFALAAPLIKLGALLRPELADELERDYQRVLVEIADPDFVNWQRVKEPEQRR